MTNRLKILSLLLIVPLALAGCNLYTDGVLTPNRVQVKEGKTVHEVDLKDIDEEYLKAVSYHYHKHGDGPVELTVTYDPSSSDNTARKANRDAARIAEYLDLYGVKDVKTDIMPVHGSETDAMAMMGYTSYTADRPEGCEELMPGVESTDTGKIESYTLGCTMDTLIARQVARPKDLLGENQGETSGGRRGSNIVDIYRSGLALEPLAGESASGE